MNTLPRAPDRLHVDLGAPIADGICFDDLHGLPASIARSLTARGLVWLTRFRDGDFHGGGTVIAADAHQAARIADARGLGETIVGRLDEGRT